MSATASLRCGGTRPRAIVGDGLLAVEAACLEALRQGVHSADVILNILSRRREPPPPCAVMAPDARQLRLIPAADATIA